MRQIKIAVFTALSLATLGLLIWAFTPKADAAAPGTKATSGDDVWEKIDNSSIASADWQAPAAGSYRVLRLNKAALARQLARAPMERTADLRNSPAVLSLPMPDGSFQRFLIEESPVMDTELVARYPEIKSYRGQGIEDGAATVRFDWTPRGFHALVLSADRAVNILPPNQADLTTYASYYDQGEVFKCYVTAQHQTTKAIPGGVRPDVAVGATLRTYRIAIAATNEFCVLLGSNTVANSTAAMNAFLNGINAIWERELSVHMNLVNAPNVVYAGDNVSCGGACNAANDPYTNGNTIAMLNEVRPDLATKVGMGNYDIGHVLGTNSGGVAYVGVVCQDGLCNNEPGACKGGGASGMGAPVGNSGSVGLWAHELGHQFAGNHTQNGTGAQCAEPNRNGTTAFEPGSGTTILSYVGICATDNVASSRDLRWHAGTFQEISTFLAGAQAMGCAVNTATGNNIPTVNAGAPSTIPRNTPFTLTAAGTDADPGDLPNLTFIWEQIDAGGVCPGAGCFSNPPYGDQAGDPATTTRPLFRVFSPIRDTSRTFPSLTYILNNANVPPAVLGGFQTAENLPSVSRTMNFRATVRDNRAGFGGVNDSSVAITVDGNSGPFAVTAPNGGGTLSGAQNVTWSVNNTNAPPVNCANARITLSTDGGQTFPITLAATTANIGTAAVTIPNGITSTTARVKVEAVGNIFFDISDANFTIVPADTCPAVSNINPRVGNTGDAVTITGVNFMNGGNVTGVKFTSNVTATFTVVNDTTITTTVPAGAAGGAITISKAGCPDVQTTAFSVCTGAPTALAIDDGSVETASSNGSGAYYVNRLTPATYPATLSQISIFWDPFQVFPPGTAITVVAGANAGGTANIDGTTFQTFPATAGAQPGFTTYTLPNPLTITAGDFVVGFQVPIAPAGSFAIAIDSDNPMSRSYNSGNGTSFTNVTDGNYMIRTAQVFTGCSAGTTTVQFAAGSARVPENAGLVELNVTRTGDTSGTTTMNFATGGGTATPGQDYTPESGQLTFAPSETSKTISVPIINDNVVEPDETFLVTLSPPAGTGSRQSSARGAALPITQETVTIADDDGAPTASQVVSRKLHNGAPFDINLPLAGGGIECRSGGATNDYQVVFTFPTAVTFSSASVTSGSGSVSSSSGSGTATITVNLTSVANAQRITVTLLGVNNGTSTGPVPVQMGVLIGDTNADGFVNSGDSLQTRSRSGQTANATNFRSDVNTDGTVNSGDTLAVRNRSGTFLPP